MSPREQVKALYVLYPQPRSFEEDESLHRAIGYVIESSDWFLMGRAVDSKAPVEAIVCPHLSFAREVQDAWFIWAYSGELRAMLYLAPYWLPLVGWARRNGMIRWYRCEEMLRKVSGRRAR